MEVVTLNLVLLVLMTWVSINMAIQNPMCDTIPLSSPDVYENFSLHLHMQILTCDQMILYLRGLAGVKEEEGVKKEEKTVEVSREGSKCKLRSPATMGSMPS